MLKRICIIVLLLSQGLFIFAQNKTYDGCEISYENLRSTLYHASPHHLLSSFVNLDISLPNELLQTFLQTEMNLHPYDDSCKWVSDTHLQLEFGPGIIWGNEVQYLQIHYYLKPTVNVPVSSISEKETCSIIEKCVITGTPDLVLKLFVNYWGESVKIGGQIYGEIAHADFMGDHIALYAVSNSLYKIIITNNSSSFSYKANFAKDN